MIDRYLPIIYIRGYAGSRAAVESAVESPYYGFNDGSSKVRTGPEGDPELFIFESPLVRLMKDHDYTDFFVRVHQHPSGKHFIDLLKSNGQDNYPLRSLWIFRYYDDTSKDLGSNTRHPIESLGQQLVSLIDHVLEKTGAGQVHLVAHSMGGLICRSAIQKTMGRASAEAKIARLFTYGTPHRGIHFRHGLGWAADLRDLLGINDSDNFGPKQMRDYLGFPEDHPADRLHELGNQFDPLRCFSLVGTNQDDYTVRSARFSVGPGSDGLVMRKNAYIKGSNRAYVHRSHSGPYGLVNSEEGYQNLQRFLFGDAAVKISLANIRPKDALRSRRDGSTLQRLLIECEFSMRGELIQLNQQLERDGSAEPVKLESIENGKETLFRAFLLRKQRPSGQFRYSQFQLIVRVVPIYVKERMIRGAHTYAGQKLFEATLFVGVADQNNDGSRRVKMAWGPMDDVLARQPAQQLESNDQPHHLPLPLDHSFLETGELIFEIERWG